MHVVAPPRFEPPVGEQPLLGAGFILGEHRPSAPTVDVQPGDGDDPREDAPLALAEIVEQRARRLDELLGRHPHLLQGLFDLVAAPMGEEVAQPRDVRDTLGREALHFHLAPEGLEPLVFPALELLGEELEQLEQSAERDAQRLGRLELASLAQVPLRRLPERGLADEAQQHLNRVLEPAARVDHEPLQLFGPVGRVQLGAGLAHLLEHRVQPGQLRLLRKAESPEQRVRQAGRVLLEGRLDAGVPLDVLA